MHILHDQTAKDLLGAEALDEVALQNSSDCVALLDGSGRIIDHSDWTGSELALAKKGQSFWSVWPKDTQSALKRAVSRGLEGGITQYWSRHEHPDGTITQWDIRLSPLHDARDKVGGVLAVSRKLTAQ